MPLRRERADITTPTKNSRFKIQDSRFKIQDSSVVRVSDLCFDHQGAYKEFKIQDSRFEIQDSSVVSIIKEPHKLLCPLLGNDDLRETTEESQKTEGGLLSHYRTDIPDIGVRVRVIREMPDIGGVEYLNNCMGKARGTT